ncbi:MAG: helix-turn-helix transcriptional regulator [Paludibacteraceae bacterium]|nr:helix-turn-helix transcriptional regulator [Paludibacteraceae bacterium]
MDILYEFSSALLQARQRKEMTQEQVAWALEVSHATYNAWECGHRLCPYKHIIGLINYFDDEQFTRSMIRILLTLQHNMAGLNKMDKSALTRYYRSLMSVLADECEKWVEEIRV